MKTIGIISRLEPGKGQDIFIEALYLLKKKDEKINGLIVGEGDDSALRKKIKKLRLEENIKLLGFQRDLKKVYRQIDVFAFPTYWQLEGFGLVLLEAMNAGIPVVSTNFGPVPEVTANAAILVPPKDPKALADAIYKILKDKKLARKMIVLGKARVRQFDIKKVADSYLANFLEVVKTNA